jgi:hypothetical protein
MKLNSVRTRSWATPRYCGLGIDTGTGPLEAPKVLPQDTTS